MTLKRISKEGLLIESTNDKSSVELHFDEGSIVLTVKSDTTSIELSKPGDYEYGNITLTCHEIPSGSYLSVINIVKIGIEDVKVLFIPRQNVYSKEIVNNLANIDLVVAPTSSTDYLKKLVSDFEPQRLVIINDFGGANTLSVEDLKKSLGVQAIEEESSIKVKGSESVQTKESNLAVSLLK